MKKKSPTPPLKKRFPAWFVFSVRESSGRATDVGILFPGLRLLCGTAEEAGGDEAGCGGGKRLPQVCHQLHEGRALGIEDAVCRKLRLKLAIPAVLYLRRGDMAYQIFFRLQREREREGRL